MRRMDYPIAKAKELNIDDKEWFQRDGSDRYLKKKLTNGVYRLTGTSKIPKDNYAYVYLYGIDEQTTWYKSLFTIATPDYSIENIAGDNSGDNGLLNGKPALVLIGGSKILMHDKLCLVVKDDIVFLTAAYN